VACAAHHRGGEGGGEGAAVHGNQHPPCSVTDDGNTDGGAPGLAPALDKDGGGLWRGDAHPIKALLLQRYWKLVPTPDHELLGYAARISKHCTRGLVIPEMMQTDLSGPLDVSSKGISRQFTPLARSAASRESFLPASRVRTTSGAAAAVVPWAAVASGAPAAPKGESEDSARNTRTELWHFLHVGLTKHHAPSPDDAQTAAAAAGCCDEGARRDTDPALMRRCDVTGTMPQGHGSIAAAPNKLHCVGAAVKAI